MKKWMLCFLFGALCCIGQAQTLQFSQVLLFSTSQTVPPGKVWKITSVFPSAGAASSPTDYSINLNGNIRYVGSRAGYNHSYSATMSIVVKDAWLPAGTTIAPATSNGEISVIEFTVVP